MTTMTMTTTTSSTPARLAPASARRRRHAMLGRENGGPGVAYWGISSPAGPASWSAGASRNCLRRDPCLIMAMVESGGSGQRPSLSSVNPVCVAGRCCPGHRVSGRSEFAEKAGGVYRRQPSLISFASSCLRACPCSHSCGPQRLVSPAQPDMDSQSADVRGRGASCPSLTCGSLLSVCGDETAVELRLSIGGEGYCVPSVTRLLTRGWRWRAMRRVVAVWSEPSPSLDQVPRYRSADR